MKTDRVLRPERRKGEYYGPIPPHLNAQEVADAMVSVAGVKEVHDLHIGTITSGREALSAHIAVPNGGERDSVLGNLQQLLRERFHIDHLTLEMVKEPSERIQLRSAKSTFWEDSEL